MLKTFFVTFFKLAIFWKNKTHYI